MSWPFLFSYILPIFFASHCIFKWLVKLIRNKTYPPSPPKLPIIGHFHIMGSLLHHTLYSLSQNYGHLMLLYLGTKPTLVVSSGEAAREIMKSNDVIFANRPKSTIIDKLEYGSRDVVFSPLGEYWKHIRSLTVVALLSKKRVASFQFIREEEVIILIKNISDSCSSPNNVINLSAMVVSLTKNVVSRVAFGTTYNSEAEEGMRFKKLLGELVQLLGTFDVGDYIPWLRWVNYLNGMYRRADRVAKDLDAFFESVIEEHLQREQTNSDDSKDYVDVLLQYQRKNTYGFSLSREGIKALILDTFAAGTDTTFTAIEWTLAELMRNPRVLNKLQEEVRGIFKAKRTINEDDLEKILYLKAVVKESYRLHPPNPLLVRRESSKDVKLMGYDIEAGTEVIINAWAIGRDPSIWDEPDEFRPERFMSNSVDFRGHDFQLIPFGAGRRRCPGVEFAVSVEELVLANLVNRFNFGFSDGMGPKDLDMDEVAGISVHKKTPLLVTVNLAQEE